MKSKLETYALIVCFFTLVALLPCIFYGVLSVVKVANPELMVDSRTYAQFRTNESFWNSKEPCTDDHSKPYVRRPMPSEEIVTKQREIEWANEIASMRREGVQLIIDYTIFIFVLMVNFGIHWLIAKKVRGTSA